MKHYPVGKYLDSDALNMPASGASFGLNLRRGKERH
jgi:hypothetical protein